MAEMIPGAADSIVMVPVTEIRPYEKNPRKNAQAVDAVAASIKAYGFKSPILLTEGYEIINGHTRFKAAKKLGMKAVPCVIAYGLKEEQIRQYRLIDNKTSEYAEWDRDLLEGELNGLEMDLDFDFDFSDDLKRIAAWGTTPKFCDLKEKPGMFLKDGRRYYGIFRTGKEGKKLEEIKVPESVPYFTETALRFIFELLGVNLRTSGWCIATTPRRRHRTGFHFATEICYALAENLCLPFYEDIVICSNRGRLFPIMEQIKFPAEKNIILYDDILTTGTTMKTTREMLADAGYTVVSVVSIVNT